MSLPVIPAPAQTTAADGTYTLTATTGIAVAAPDLAGPATRFIQDVALDTGLELTGTAGITLAIEPVDEVDPVAGLRADGESVDERHGLEITGEGIRVWGPTPEAVHRGLTSLRQLISAHLHDGSAVLPATHIVDGPRFAWRGLSFDVVRTFHGPDEVRRVIDMLALYKLNVLHLHLTDDQGWRVEVPSRPALTEVGARGALGDRPGGYYSQAELAELVQYAAERYVTVVPEIDMPGHTTAVFAAYPELAPTELRSIDFGDGNSVPLNALQPDRAETWAFVEDVLDAVIPQFPQSAYVHIGGDETWGMPDEDHAAFVERAAALVRARGKKVVGWQEIARGATGPDDVAQYWISIDIDAMDTGNAPRLPENVLPMLLEHFQKAKLDAPKALAAGTRLIASPTTWVYFDRPHGDPSSDPAQEEARKRLGLEFYGPATLRDGISWDPVENTPGVTSTDQLVGVEAAIWCETILSSEDLELMLLPRLPGAAEKAWSHHTPTDWPAYATRLAQQSPTWRHRTWTWHHSTEIKWH
ncbi:family 20 glycosylhydrolase [Kribbella solani]|uniref:beta-N-acetylhexosaminidase n=1 Tax=Kribbella solani TaxID=236067 RepID=UPI0029ADE939|nr:family 20 glycosylhydrolase [Kribbella solani]MDX3002994.1 family 20 glycosylhydrolase [Kribbella solani]